uniref:Transport and Golgi organization protein 2 n=1 Tax=Syphacia muris TaxID=451379 RepID=A0A0N5AYT4_9BILA
MCVTFVYLNPSAIGNAKDYQLIILNNRDESFDRPTSFAGWENGILAGRDEAISNERGGTWLGMREDGKIGVLLSMLEKAESMKTNAPTRGRIVCEYLASKCTANEYAQLIAEQGSQFNGFNLLLFDRVERNGKILYNLATVSNSSINANVENFYSGVYGFGNSSRLSPFKKVAYGTRLFEDAVKQNMQEKNDDLMIEQFLRILRDNTCHHPDQQLLSQTDQSEECSRAMSQLFYRFPPPHRYGTRSQTIVLVKGDGRAVFYECSMINNNGDYGCDDSQWPKTKFVFQLHDP